MSESNRASRRGDFETLLLLDGIDVNKKDNENNVLILASWYGHAETVKLLIGNGANVNEKNKYGITALIKASTMGNTEIVKLLLKAGATVNEKDRFGETALMWASMGGSEETVKLLIKAGANIYEKDNDGDTALKWASCRGYAYIINLLKDPPKRSLFSRCVSHAYLHRLDLETVPDSIKAAF